DDQHRAPGLEAGDPPRREIHYADDGGADEFLGLVGGDLGACDPFAQRAEIEAHFVGWTARLRELLDGGDQGRPYVHGEEMPGGEGWENFAGFVCMWRVR